MSPEREAALTRLCVTLTRQGNMLAAGFAVLQLAWIPDDAPLCQVNDLHFAYMAGARRISDMASAIVGDRKWSEAERQRVADKLREELDLWCKAEDATLDMLDGVLTQIALDHPHLEGRH